MKIRIGTRGSQLALWQAFYIENLLKAAGMATEIVTIETKGDKILDVSLSKIGSKGVFTEELEDQLRSGDIDIAVHSAKDLQSDLHEDFEILAFTERELVNDVVVSLNPNFSLADQSQKLVVGTSSTRRIALMQRNYPHVQLVEMRGNLQTRLKKLADGHCQALLLAYAGVHRMNYHQYIVQHLPLDSFTPAVGQGSVAVEVARSLSDDKKAIIRQACNHVSTEICLLAERAFLNTMQGGCSVPVFGLAQWHGTQLQLKGGVVSLDGKQLITHSLSEEKAEGSSAKNLGKAVAQEILAQGGGKILEEIRRNR